MKPHRKKILVIGSSNTDMVVKTSGFPSPGQTVLGGDFFMFPGGKGANQAVAAARLGGDVTFVCKLGMDIFGDAALEGFKKEGIDCRYIIRDPVAPTGVALITINESGQNTIVVAPGANAALSVDDINRSRQAIDETDILLLQLEIPMETVEYAIRMAYEAGKIVVLNPAPAAPLPDHIWHQLFLFTPNESEASLYAGIPLEEETDAQLAAQALLNKGVENLLLTLGKNGALLVNRDMIFRIPAFKVKAKDTTAAGDVFNGALCVALSEELDFTEAMEFASRAAAISVTRMGAQSSAPTRSEVMSFKP